MRTRLFLAAAVAAGVALASPAFAQPKDIVDTAVAAGSFKTLARLLGEAELVGVMKGPGPYTVFAPTDEAFAKVPKAVLDGLVKDKAKLQAVLEYHVLTSRWTSDDIKLVKQTGTVQGKPVSFAVSGGAITVNGAKVIKANVGCTNGMIHVIDTVLLPPQ
ncbi:MAG: fasciclin domain-containing protein [Betaproteobacteria bacterium]